MIDSPIYDWQPKTKQREVRERGKEALRLSKKQKK